MGLLALFGSKSSDSTSPERHTSPPALPPEHVSVICDSASSVCIDGLEEETLAVEDAIRVLAQVDPQAKMNDFETYNKQVALDLLGDERRAYKHISSVNDQEAFSTYTVDIDQDSVANYTYFSKYGRTSLFRSTPLTSFVIIIFAGYMSLAYASNEGLLIVTVGPVGGLIGLFASASICFAVFASTAEMMAVWPLEGGFTAYGERLVSKSFGFALGVSCWLTYAVTIPMELLLSLGLLPNFPALNTADSQPMIWGTYFLILVTVFNFLAVRHVSRGFMLIALVCAACSLLFCIVYFALASGVIPPLFDKSLFRYWDPSKSTEQTTYGPFRPSFGVSHIKGSAGRFMQVWLSSSLSLRVFCGAEKLLCVVPEVRNPRKSIKRGVWAFSARIVFFIFILFFSFSLVFGPTKKAGEMVLMFIPGSRTSADNTPAQTRSPLRRCGIHAHRWTNFRGYATNFGSLIALARNQLCSLMFFLNACFAVFGVASAAFSFYASSRILHGLGFSHRRLSFLTKLSRDGVPYLAVWTTFPVCLLLYLGSFISIPSVCSFLQSQIDAMASVIWAALCLCYLRFYKCVSSSQDVDRDCERYPYKSPLQPYLAWYGLVASIFNALSLCIPEIVFVMKPDIFLSVFFFFPQLLFAVIFLAHRFGTKSTLVKLNEIDIGRAYTLLDSQEWEEDRVYHQGFRESVHRALKWTGRTAVSAGSDARNRLKRRFKLE